MQAFKTWAKIFEIDESKQVFSAFLYDDTYKVYSFKDYGRLIFDTSNEAEEAAERLPKPQTIVFQVIGKKVYKKIVIGIDEQYTDGVYDLVVCLNKGKDVSTKEIGHSLFINESDARKQHKR